MAIYEVKMYRSDKSGEIFNSEEEAKKYEILMDEIKEAESLIIRNEKSNSPIGIQNDPEKIELFYKKFRELLVKYAPTKYVEAWDQNKRGIIGRYLNDWSGYGREFWGLYYRGIMCVGRDGKSYGQPYYATKN